MKVEILHIADCPNWQDAGRRMQEALTATDHDHVAVAFRLLLTSEDAAGAPFAGSPTITVDGADLFPTADRITDLACRIYSTPDGLAGSPTADQITDALRDRGALITECSCCGRPYPRRKLHDVGGTGTLICRRCGLWVARRVGSDRM